VKARYMTTSRTRRFLRGLSATAVAVLMSVAAHAQETLRDAETERLMKDITGPIFDAAKIPRSSVNLYLLNDNSINAFVAEGQNIFMHTGLILRADNVNQVIGVYAHETGHITGGHLYRQSDGAKGATGISLLSMLLAAGAIAAGAGDAGIAIMQGGQALAYGNFAAYTRSEESSADQAGATLLQTTHQSGKGMIEFFNKLQSDEYRLGVKQETYFRSHPLSSDRIEALQQRLEESPSYNAPINPDFEYRFQRIKAKLAGFINEPQRTFQLYPESNTSEYAHYARAYAWHKLGDLAKAREEMAALLKLKPNDPYYLELEGQVLLESGEVKESIPPLRQSIAIAPNEPLIQSLLGHALISTEDDRDFAEARKILENSVRLDPDNPFAWYQLGIVYSRSGDEPRASLASAERFSRAGQAPEAAANARRAVAGLAKGTPEWVRASDILVIAENDLRKKKYRNGGPRRS
jgi:predicted Zn-dependent protease